MGLKPLGPVDYSSTVPPPKYRCTFCKKNGRKLWREPQTFLEHQTLACVDCAAKEEDFPVEVDDEGRHNGKMKFRENEVLELGMTDQLGGRVPAVPTEDGETYWGYTSVPEPGVLWWRHLPTRV